MFNSGGLPTDYIPHCIWLHTKNWLSQQEDWTTASKSKRIISQFSVARRGSSFWVGCTPPGTNLNGVHAFQFDVRKPILKFSTVLGTNISNLWQGPNLFREGCNGTQKYGPLRTDYIAVLYETVRAVKQCHHLKWNISSVLHCETVSHMRHPSMPHCIVQKSCHPHLGNSYDRFKKVLV